MIFDQQLPDFDAEYVELCHGKTVTGREFHAFIQMTFGQYAHYKRLLEGGQHINLNEIGKVLHAGWGSEPSVDIARRIMRQHTDNLKIVESLARQQRDINELIRTHNSEGFQQNDDARAD